MTKTGIVALIIVVIVGLGAGVWALSHKSSPTTGTTTSTDTSQNPTPSSSPTNSTPAANQAQSANTIAYTDNGFSPASLTVKSGDQVTITNNSSRLLQFDSDPHPQHTDDPELNVGTIAPGQSRTITVHTTGSHGYHNHLNADDIGTLVVQ